MLSASLIYQILKHFDVCCHPSTEKVVGTATPREPPEQWKAAWYFSTGDELLLRWESSPSLLGLSFCLRNQATESTVCWEFSLQACVW